MFIVESTDLPTQAPVGAVKTDMGDINPFLIAGAVGGVGVAGFGVMLAATAMPAQTLGAAAISAGLLGYGVYSDQQSDEKSTKKSDKKSDTKSEIKAEPATA